MSFSFRPAKRENTPLIIGLAGPTKSGKTYSALRLATGLAGGGKIIMLNTEGPRGHLYADTFKYETCDLEAPYRAAMFVEALQAVASAKPAVVIVDSASAMHDGPGGTLEYKEEILDRMAGTDERKRDRSTFSAWIKPKAAENAFIYQMLSMAVPVILCMRAKDKTIIRKGQDPEFKWGPIIGEAVSFETIFTLMFLPGSKGVPTLELSDLRTPFDLMIPLKRQIDESLGQALAAWAKGGTPSASRAADQPPVRPTVDSGATSGGGTGGIPPGMTARDDWQSRWLKVSSAQDYDDLNAEMTTPSVWNAFKGPDQKALLASRQAAKTRIGR